MNTTPPSSIVPDALLVELTSKVAGLADALELDDGDRLVAQMVVMKVAGKRWAQEVVAGFGMAAIEAMAAQDVIDGEKIPEAHVAYTRAVRGTACAAAEAMWGIALDHGRVPAEHDGARVVMPPHPSDCKCSCRRARPGGGVGESEGESKAQRAVARRAVKGLTAAESMIDVMDRIVGHRALPLSMTGACDADDVRQVDRLIASTVDAVAAGFFGGARDRLLLRAKAYVLRLNTDPMPPLELEEIAHIEVPIDLFMRDGAAIESAADRRLAAAVVHRVHAARQAALLAAWRGGAPSAYRCYRLICAHAASVALKFEVESNVSAAVATAASSDEDVDAVHAGTFAARLMEATAARVCRRMPARPYNPTVKAI